MSLSNKRICMSLSISVAVIFLALSICILPLGVLSGGGASASPGSGWEQQASGTTAELRAVSAVDADNVWVAGEGVLLKTGDGGASWQKVYESASTHFFDVCAVDVNNVWVVGREGDATSGTGFIYKTEDGGANWVPQYFSAAPDYFTAISAVSSDIAWTAGTSGMILKTMDGGDSWISQNSGTPMMLSSVCAVDANTAYAVGWSVHFVPFHTSIGGLYTYIRFPPYYIPPATFAPYYPIILKTADGGATWAAQQLGTYDEGFSDISAADAYNAIAVGKDILYSPIPVLDYVIDQGMYWYLQALSSYGALFTHDGGSSWPAQAVYISFATLLDGVDMVDTETAWEVGNWGAILKTIDGGSTGVEQASGTQSALKDVAAVDACTAWAVGGNGTILKTSDGGDARPDIASISPDTGPSGTEVVISGCDFGDTRGSSYVSFGGIQAVEYTSWSSGEIAVKAPVGVGGTVEVTVTTPQGTSNPKPFTAPTATVTVTSIAPNQAMQNTVSLEITDLAGTGFMPGATVRLEKGAAVINAYNVNVVSGTRITCTLGFVGVEPGVYDVVVVNPDSQGARLPGAFTVTAQCGAGSGAALLMLGLSLGLLSLAGTAGLRRRRT
jgi:photosystem II stability/assembly factor-like uncharacterized protein